MPGCETASSAGVDAVSLPSLRIESETRKTACEGCTLETGGPALQREKALTDSSVSSVCSQCPVFAQLSKHVLLTVT